MIYLVFSVQFFNLPYLFAKFYWHISTVNKYFILSALSFLQTKETWERSRKMSDDLWWNITKWQKDKTYVLSIRAENFCIGSFCFDRNKQKRGKRIFSLFCDTMVCECSWYRYDPITILYDTYIGTVCQKLSICCESEVFSYNIFRKRKAVNSLVYHLRCWRW